MAEAITLYLIKEYNEKIYLTTVGLFTNKL